jgi:hypothetical protein
MQLESGNFYKILGEHCYLSFPASIFLSLQLPNALGDDLLKAITQ